MAAPKKDNRGSGGKLLDTWHYEYEGIASKSDDDDDEPKSRQVQPIKVPVELRLIKEFSGDTPPMAVKGVHFLIECKAVDISLEGDDVELLRKTMWGQLDARYAVAWSKYFLVTIEERQPYDGIGEGFVFGYEDIEKGIAWDGTLLMRRGRYSSREVIEPWPSEFRDKRGRVQACIPAHKANQLAMKEFCDRIDQLREALVDLIRPETIERTLANLSGLLLLPPKTEEAEFDLFSPAKKDQK